MEGTGNGHHLVVVGQWRLLEKKSDVELKALREIPFFVLCLCNVAIKRISGRNRNLC